MIRDFIKREVQWRACGEKKRLTAARRAVRNDVMGRDCVPVDDVSWPNAGLPG
jgi:hypothetical protein